MSRLPTAREPIWLTPDEQAAWRSYLVSFALLMRTLDRQMQRDSGMSHPDYAVLVQLSERPEFSATITELAQLMDHSQSRTSHAVARLGRRGLVRREADGLDRRVVHVRLTPDGLAQLRAAAPGHVRCVREVLFDPLSPAQLAAFRTICDGMIDRIGRD